MLHIIERQSCEDYSQYHDLALFSKILKDVSFGKVVSLVSEAELRVSRAVSMVIDVKVVEPRVIRSDHGRTADTKTSLRNKVSLPYGMIEPDFVTLGVKVFPHFVNTTVEFFGESPMILGSTPILRTVNSLQEADHAFVRDYKSIPLALKSRNIWVPHDVQVIGYSKTKYVHYNYVCWQRGDKLYYDPVLRVVEQPLVQSGYRAKTRIKTNFDSELRGRFKEKNKNNVGLSVPVGVDGAYHFVGPSPFINKLEDTPTLTQKLNNVLTGRSSVFEKEVECFVKKHLCVAVKPEDFDSWLKNKFNVKYNSAMEHVLYLRENGLIDQTATSIKSVMAF